MTVLTDAISTRWCERHAHAHELRQFPLEDIGTENETAMGQLLLSLNLVSVTASVTATTENMTLQVV